MVNQLFEYGFKYFKLAGCDLHNQNWTRTLLVIFCPAVFLVVSNTIEIMRFDIDTVVDVTNSTVTIFQVCIIHVIICRYYLSSAVYLSSADNMNYYMGKYLKTG